MKTAPLCQNTINCPSVSRRTPFPNIVPFSSNEWNDSSLLTPSNVLMHFKFWYSCYAHPIFFVLLFWYLLWFRLQALRLKWLCLCCAFWQFLLCILSITTVALYSHSTKIANTHFSLSWSLQPLQLKIFMYFAQKKILVLSSSIFFTQRTPSLVCHWSSNDMFWRSSLVITDCYIY